MDALLRRRAMIAMGGSPTPPPPPPPTNIAYIRGGGDGSYIDTGITPDNTTKVIVWARNFNPGGGNLFGSRTSASSNRFCLLTPGAVNAGRIRIDYGNANDAYADDQFANLSHYHKYELYQGVLKIDDVTIASTGTQPTFSGTYNLYLFGNNNAGTLQSLNVPADICACKIYKGGVLVRDYTAVNSPSVGLYDAVSETVFTNAGSGAFSYGTFDSSAYTPLEYIECSGGQYFTTPESGKYSTRIVTKFRSTPPSAVWGHIIGGNNATQKCDVFTGNASIKNSKLYAILGTGSAGQIKSTSTSGYFDNRDIIVVKANNVFTGYENNASIGSETGTTSTSFDTGIPMSVGALNNNGTITEYFYGRIYYVGVGGCNYVPADVNNVSGMYDTYNDVFKPSESGTPFIAGSEYPARTSYFRNKKIALIGDSISTYNQDGYKYDSYRMYYPVGNVDTVDETWWKRLMDTENCTLDVNLAYSGSFSSGYNPDYPTFYDRTGLITDAEIIIVAIGTNDSTNSVPLGTFDYTTDPSNLDMSKFRESYIKGIRSLMTLYPSASIVCAIFSMGSDYRDSIKTIAEHYGLVVVDCGNDYEKYTTVHPNANGMIQIYRNFLYV